MKLELLRGYDPRSMTALAEAWLALDEASVLAELRSADISMSRRRAIVDLLRATDSAALRNAAALALVDRGADEAAAEIIALLRRPDIATEAGTLLYALDELGVDIPLDVAVGLIAGGSYEARSQALLLIEEGRVRSAEPPSRTEAFLDRLRALAASEGTESAEAARSALELLADRASS